MFNTNSSCQCHLLSCAVRKLSSAFTGTRLELDLRTKPKIASLLDNSLVHVLSTHEPSDPYCPVNHMKTRKTRLRSRGQGSGEKRQTLRCKRVVILLDTWLFLAVWSIAGLPRQPAPNWDNISHWICCLCFYRWVSNRKDSEITWWVSTPLHQPNS